MDDDEESRVLINNFSFYTHKEFCWSQKNKKIVEILTSAARFVPLTSLVSVFSSSAASTVTGSWFSVLMMLGFLCLFYGKLKLFKISYMSYVNSLENFFLASIFFLYCSKKWCLINFQIFPLDLNSTMVENTMNVSRSLYAVVAFWGGAYLATFKAGLSILFAF